MLVQGAKRATRDSRGVTANENKRLCGLGTETLQIKSKDSVGWEQKRSVGNKKTFKVNTDH